MNSEQKGKEIILNDTFQSKRINAYNLLLASEDYQSPGVTKKGKEILTYRIDDLQDVMSKSINVAGGYYTYDSRNATPNPANYPYSWYNPFSALDFPFGSDPGYDPDFGYLNPYDYSNQPGDNFTIFEISEAIKGTSSGIELSAEFPGLRGSILLNDSSNGAQIYCSKKVSIPASWNNLNNCSKCYFTIGFAPADIRGTSGQVPFTETAKSIDYTFYRDGSRFSQQSSFISHSYSIDGTNSIGSIFVFRAYCTNPSETDVKKLNWEIYVYDSWSDTATKGQGTKITLNGANNIRENWDGLTLCSFVSLLTKNNDDTYTRELAIQDNIYDGSTIIGTKLTTVLKKTISATEVQINRIDKKLGQKIVVGSMGGKYFSCIALRDFLFVPDTKYEYNYHFDNSGFASLADFMQYQSERTSSIVGCSDKFETSWDFIRSQLDEKDDIGAVIKVNDKKEYQSTGTSTITVSLDPDLIQPGKNEDKLNIFTSKDKQVTIEAPTGKLFEYRNPGKNIYHLNCVQMTGLSTIDVSNNLLSKLDLSNCTKLKTVNVSENNKLRKLILPHTLTNNIAVNITGCPTLSEIVFPYKGIGGRTITLTVDAEVKLKTIQLVNTESSASTLIIDGDISGILSNIITLSLQKVNCTSFMTFPTSCPIKEINISEAPYLTTLSNVQNLINSLPAIDGKPGRLYMYGKKYTVNSVQGNIDAIATEVEAAKNKNWLIYV